MMMQSILHHCKNHKSFDETCKKCAWWTKHGKCQNRKPLKIEKLFLDTVEFYMKGKDPNDMEAKKKANEIAQTVVERAMKREEEFVA